MWLVKVSLTLSIPSKNRLAKNIEILQVFFLQDLQGLALNLASFALKMKLFLQDMKNLVRKNCKIIFLQDFILQVLQEKYLQDFHISCKTVFTGYVGGKRNNYTEFC